MIYRVLLVFGILICAHYLVAQVGPVGIWQAIDDDDGEATSHIEIFDKNDMLYAKVVKLLRKDPDLICEKCKGDKKGQKVVGMEIMWDMKKDGKKKEWKSGKILDPENGKEYKCKLKLKSEDVLEVRGYIGFSLLGRTQKWYKVKAEINDQ